jgi:hypothetical protein
MVHIRGFNPRPLVLHGIFGLIKAVFYDLAFLIIVFILVSIHDWTHLSRSAKILQSNCLFGREVFSKNACFRFDAYPG